VTVWLAGLIQFWKQTWQIRRGEEEYKNSNSSALLLQLIFARLETKTRDGRAKNWWQTWIFTIMAHTLASVSTHHRRAGMSNGMEFIIDIGNIHLDTELYIRLRFSELYH
jgi:hypothetical protein